MPGSPAATSFREFCIESTPTMLACTSSMSLCAGAVSLSGPSARPALGLGMLLLWQTLKLHDAWKMGTTSSLKVTVPLMAL